jgi:hypothetical protein
MSTVYEVRHRVLRERLKQTVATAKGEPDEVCARLALLCLALLERHTVNGKGRCRYCRAPHQWRWRKSCRCTVVPMVSMYLKQPLEFLNGWRGEGEVHEFIASPFMGKG